MRFIPGRSLESPSVVEALSKSIEELSPSERELLLALAHDDMSRRNLNLDQYVRTLKERLLAIEEEVEGREGGPD